MSLFTNAKVSVKIFSGYILALALMVAVGGLAIFRLNEMEKTVSELTGNLAIDRQLGNDIVAQVLRTRLYATKYINTQDSQALDNYNKESAILETYFTQAQTDIVATDRAVLVDQIADGYETYTTNFEKIRQALLDQQKTQTDVLDVQGPEIDENLNQWRAAKLESGEISILQGISNVQVKYNNMRLNGYKYLATGDEQYLDLFDANYDSTLVSLDELETMLGASDQADYTAVRQKIESYTTTFKDMEASFTLVKDTQVNVLDIYGPQIRKDASAIVTSVGNEFETLAKDTSDIAIQTRLILLVTISIALVVGIGLGWVISRGITLPLAQVAQLARQIAENDLRLFAGELEELANGNLNRRFTPTVAEVEVQSADEVGMLTRSFNLMVGSLHSAAHAFGDMTHNLHTLVGQVAENAASVSVASGQLATAADQAGQATSQIAATIQEVAKGTSQQAEAATRTAAAVEMMSHSIQNVDQGAQEQTRGVTKTSKLAQDITTAVQQVTGNAEMVTKQSSQATNAARMGVQSVNRTVEGMTSIRAKVGLSAEKVKEMGQRSDQIGMIVETIEDIASQTNLLALNAAIEAARAGEHGKGFAVVADEVRKLAERASVATKEIGGLIRSIQTTVLDAVSAMDEGAQEVENGVKLVNQAGNSLGEIVTAAEGVMLQAQEAQQAAQRMMVSSKELTEAMLSVSSVVEKNTTAVKEMASNSSEVTQSIESIASVSEENSAAIEQVSASTEEMSAQVEEVTAAAQSLAEMAKLLQAAVGQFKFDRD